MSSKPIFEDLGSQLFRALRPLAKRVLLSPMIPTRSPVSSTGSWDVLQANSDPFMWLEERVGLVALL